MPTVKEATEQVDAFKTSVKEDGERMVVEILPLRILEINELLAKPPFTSKQLSDFHSDLHVPVPGAVSGGGGGAENNGEVAPPAAKRRRSVEESGAAAAGDALLPHGSIPINTPITDVIAILKPIIRRIMEETNLLKMWVTYMIPKIEDGNNFGVSIQEDALGEVASAETESASHFYEISRYYSFRAKLISKVAKYPHIDDYRRAVNELDEKQFVSLRLTLVEIRNRYATLHDVISKNLAKIKKPRSGNTADSMY